MQQHCGTVVTRSILLDRVITKPDVYRSRTVCKGQRTEYGCYNTFVGFFLEKMDIHMNRPWFVPNTLVPIDPPVGQPPEFDLPMF